MSNLKSQINTNSKILITSGGGGHFSPALSVIDALQKDIEILVVGRKYALEGDSALSLEYQTTRDLGIPFKYVTAGRLQRKFTSHTIPSLLKFPVGLVQSWKIINEFKPDLILSFGGYISLPIIFAGFLRRIPIVIHEQTLGAGLSNKIASYFARKVCISWESSRALFPQRKVVLTGNPMKELRMRNARPEGLGRGEELRIKNTEKLPVLLVTGGSAGSHAINVLIEQIVGQLLTKMVVVHQTGDAREFGDYERLEKLRETFPSDLKDRYHLMRFITPSDFASILSQSNLVVARSGMNTVSEIISLGKPSLLIPLPFSQGGEQQKNAEFVEKLGVGKALNQNSLTSERLMDEILEMLSKEAKYEKMGKEAQKVIPHDATKRLLQVVFDILPNA